MREPCQYARHEQILVGLDMTKALETLALSPTTYQLWVYGAQ
jgi:hypothetical protein